MKNLHRTSRTVSILSEILFGLISVFFLLAATYFLCRNLVILFNHHSVTATVLETKKIHSYRKSRTVLHVTYEYEGRQLNSEISVSSGFLLLPSIKKANFSFTNSRVDLYINDRFGIRLKDTCITETVYSFLLFLGAAFIFFIFASGTDEALAKTEASVKENPKDPKNQIESD